MSQESQDRALSILARSLERNQTSVFLWRVYLSLYLSRDSSKVPETRQILEDAITFNPACYHIWKLYLKYEMTPKHKIQIYEKAIYILCSHAQQGK
jgi:hypothetical protein